MDYCLRPEDLESLNQSELEQLTAKEMLKGQDWTLPLQSRLIHCNNARTAAFTLMHRNGMKECPSMNMLVVQSSARGNGDTCIA